MNYEYKIRYLDYEGFLNAKTNQVFFYGRLYSDINRAIENVHVLQKDLREINRLRLKKINQCV